MFTRLSPNSVRKEGYASVGSCPRTLANTVNASRRGRKGESLSLKKHFQECQKMYVSGHHTGELVYTHEAEENTLGMIRDFNTCEDCR